MHNGRCANGNKFINFLSSGSLRKLKIWFCQPHSQLSIRPSLGIREEKRGGQGTFAVPPFRSLLLQILILGWSTVSQNLPTVANLPALSFAPQPTQHHSFSLETKPFILQILSIFKKILQRTYGSLMIVAA